MPRISAATVADHRASQHAALLAAAMEILAAEGAAGLTPAAVGARVGLARSSVYRYFSSTADILAQLVEDAIPRWAGRLESATARGGGARERVRAYGEVTLSFATHPDYALLRALSAVELPPECRDRLDELHQTLIAPLRAVLADAGEPHPGLVAQLGWSVLGEGMRRLAAAAGPATDSSAGPSAHPSADPSAEAVEDPAVIMETTLTVLCRAVLP
ncbi:TetR family transcriptional regulator [Nonomuraea phyllanthi]|uniref:TetR family transcriptional regulator n=1 Tax=Nonomuraea phyllanthi TaxID=2219224 RepID=A0A5C4V348_9ACTN|nr:TetR/AcrR family transcriptional regulator [Nonomuraea phyllanthi]KAB8185738.1 TetR family transcriptional regulator [Nonomuraea phyllanthi]QFY11194.1 TetR family transcriptional regulator [Nonomuraea phyllanthi]